MLQFFRTNHLFASLLLIFYALLLRLPSWWLPSPKQDDGYSAKGILGVAVQNWAAEKTSWPIALSIFLVFITALVANQMVSNERLSRQNTQFAGLFLILLSSLFPALTGLHSMSIANFFLLLSVWSTFKLYKNRYTAKAAFNAGFLLGIACLFDSSFSLYLLWLFIAVAVLNSLHLRLLLRILVGWFTALWLAGSYWYSQGQLAHFLEAQKLSFHLPSFQIATLWNLSGIVVLSSVLGFVLFKNLKNVQFLNIEGQKKVGLLYWWLFFSTFLLFFHSSVNTTHVISLVIPISILLSFSFSRAGKQAAEAGHLLLFLIALVLNCLPFFMPV